MSVAFRREGDDEHLEPKFEIPIAPGPNLVTPRGLAQIADRVAALEARIAQGGDEETLKPVKRDLRYWPTGETVELGATVTFRLNGKQRILTIVGGDEADPAGGRIAFSAPLARALLGAESGEVLPFGDREDAIEVIAIAVN